MWNSLLFDDDAFENGVFATVETKKELRQMFSSEALPSTQLFETLGLNYDSNMKSGTYFMVADYTNASDLLVFVGVSIDFESEQSLDAYLEDLADDGDFDINRNLDEKDGIRYKTNVYCEGDNLGCLGIYVTKKAC